MRRSIPAAAFVLLVCRGAFACEITVQPQSTTIGSGASTTLTVTATGTDVHYRWYQIGESGGSTPIGTDSNSITVSPVDTTGYFVIACGVASNLATVKTICTHAPSITVQPLRHLIPPADDVILIVGATGGGTFSYQWYQDNGSGPVKVGTGSRLLEISPTISANYWCTVTTACGSATSNVAQVIVDSTCSDFYVLGDPSYLFSSTPGKKVTIGARVNDANAFTKFQWYQLNANGRVPLDPSGNIVNPPDIRYTVAPASSATYVLEASDNCDSKTSQPVSVYVCPMSILQQPQNASIAAGQSATLSVAADCGAPCLYQWYQISPSGSIKLGTSTAQTVTPSQTTQYFARAFVSSCEIASNAVTVTVASSCAPVGIAAQPQPATVAPGQSATLSVTPSGASPFTYRWYQESASGSILVGTSATLTVSPSQTSRYFVWAANACGRAVSNSTQVTVSCTPPSITAQPQPATITAGQSATLTAGQSATLSLTAAGTGPFTYQWYQSTPTGSVRVGGNAPSITVSPSQSATYFAWVYGPCGQAVTSAARVTVQ